MTMPQPPQRDAYYEGLPIYRLAVDVAVRIDAAVRGFSRYHKYGVGSELRRLSTEAAVLVARAREFVGALLAAPGYPAGLGRGVTDSASSRSRVQPGVAN